MDLGRGGGCALGAEAHLPPIFYYEQGRKLLEVTVQVEFLWEMKRQKEE